MKRRPTIPDLAKLAGVSVSTVNRIINQTGSVRQPTRERVLRTAEEIGFYGLGTIEHSVRKGRESHRLGVLLQQGGRTFYRNLGEALANEARRYPDGQIDLALEYLDDLSPDKVAARLIALGDTCESVALVAAQHPVVADAIDSVIARGIPVAGLIAPLSARGNVSFVGLDNWKVGRTAAWAFDRIVRVPGKIGILVGNHRYRNQEMNESGFRSYFREHNSAFTLLEPLATYESAAAARELVETLLAEHSDLCGLFVSGGGITGALAALRSAPKRKDFVAVGYELFDATRAALIDGTLTMVISHPMETFAREAIAAMIRAKRSGPEGGAQRVALGFDIYTSENV
ncbi:LacI family DNA-binding transcriptional regulator [Albidovulum sp.]|uniref:LacI family DNA-binding transcriptional regulator n=1 Tax=Albidovulum sp. TaxID=1872424 RepID=UPI001D2C760A|nr:LacI family DNA-binding transcriptional regulator [Paracoccaceae bacterium]HPE25750.1 LacI family DNA-binding transcriptional regulator [Albidovulum sp.]MCB2119830.1 LacI family DNA-binding transcriptional regulator [Paracoccaceae bacterium]MCB2122382.1 LacI family DNA-binding transcriptional regulator [Paracoccaceae bacterium]MCB2132722.1 LacI family DNA-binding transcriptional regulator [Paracoccaceae bacterium]